MNPDCITKFKADAQQIFQSGVDAADPYQAVSQCLSLKSGYLDIILDLNKPRLTRTDHWRSVNVLAFGKAACAMSKAVQDIIPEPLLQTPGLAITNYENVTKIDNFQVFGAGHPLPDQSGLDCAKLFAERAKLAQRGDLVLVLISGGGSALLPYPLAEISLNDKFKTTEHLLASGATINEINCVRKHLSQLKGGGLARLIAPADCHALILSDVLGDDLSAIASGPTVPDQTRFQDAVNILQQYNVWEKASKHVRYLLTQGINGALPETPKKDDPLFAQTSHTLIGSNAHSLKAVVLSARGLGYDSKIYSEQLTGEARTVAAQLACTAKSIIDQDFITSPVALIAGGETTVNIKGTGKGGRNQEMALAFALAAEKYNLESDWLFLSAGTDGRDGPTDAAGGIVDPESLLRMKNFGVDPIKMLDNNDSYNALLSSEDLLITGATGTNVADLQILLLQPKPNTIHNLGDTSMFNKSQTIAGFDEELFEALEQERQRQEDHIELIASENYASPRVLEAQGSVLTNKYAEGYPGKRYYGGCDFVDKAEQLAIDRVKELFGADYANVQPHSGSQANMAVYMALLQPHDTVLGLSLADGGHLTHGAKPNFSGKIYNAVQYGLDLETGEIDYQQVEDLAKEHQPKMIVAGFSAYSRIVDWARFRTIADSVGAYLMVDMAHVAGLIAADLYPNPVPYADVVTSTTHKSLRGPRGGFIICKSNPDIEKKFNSMIFPGIQGGPLMHVIAAKAVAFKEALQPDFKIYQQQVIKNAQAMAKVFINRGYDVISGGTDNHLMLVSLIPKGITGKAADAALGKAHITVNKNAVPNDPESPFVTSGIRVGTPAPTTRGFKENEVTLVANLMCDVMDNLDDDSVSDSVRAQVSALCARFPVYSD